ncbi:hypothetical protein UFOVP116_374 [uncultured Caudovirales phage]|uniref:Uncharacterized protein n=1 Tax=uncultured Caudovirales phage TaxID=2100421 RepID=A0A6J5LFA6_9CAUD|nr:hypothetical protein UFOVP116_374 [uncultured Caudovirales phage]
MALPIHLIKRHLAKRRNPSRKKLDELQHVPVGTFNIGDRVRYDYVGPCVIVRKAQNHSIILRGEANNKLYRVASTLLVAGLPPLEKKPAASDLVYRPSAIATKPKEVQKQEDVAPNFSKFSPQQLRNAQHALTMRAAAEKEAGDTEKHRKTTWLLGHLEAHNKKNAMRESAENSVLTDEQCNALIGQWLGESMSENNTSMNTKVQVIKGPKSILNKIGYVTEARKSGEHKKMFTVVYEDSSGNEHTIKLPGSSLRIMKNTDAALAEQATAVGNNINYVYSQMCDLAMKAATGPTEMEEDIDLTKMTTGALQKHYAANQANANQSPTFAAHLARVKRELNNRKFATESTAGKKAPTEKQVQTAKDRYDGMGLRIERARASVGFARGSGKIGELQQKKGDLYAAYMALKREYDEAKKETALKENTLTLPELRSKQKQLQQIQMRTDLSSEQKAKLQRLKLNLYSQARECGLGDYIAEEMSMGDYRHKRQTLQQIQMDPDTAKDPMLKKAVMIRLAKLKAEAAGLEIMEDDQQLEVGDRVIVTGKVQFEGCKGAIDQFGSGNAFVVVDLDDHGKHSFQTSDVSADADFEIDEDFAGFMKGVKRSLNGKPSAEDLKRKHHDRGAEELANGDRSEAMKHFDRYLKVADVVNTAKNQTKE